MLEVVVVTYNSVQHIGRCLASVTEHSPPGTRLHIVDNASSDGTVERVRDVAPYALVDVRPSNDGFAAANNAALKRVKSKYVLLLNPDTEVHPGTLGRLLERMESDESIGVIGCRLLTLDGTDDHAAKRMVPTPRDGLVYSLGRLTRKRIGRYLAPHVGPTETADVDAINGAFMLARRAAVDEVGLLDEGYWMYAEDIDWCTRFRRAGWRVVYDGSVTSMHMKGGSSGIRGLKLNFHFHRSMARYYLNYSPRHPLTALVVGGIAARFLVVAVVDGLRKLARPALVLARG
jgi:GT2 family glycosyltransferase